MSLAIRRCFLSFCKLLFCAGSILFGDVRARMKPADFYIRIMTLNQGIARHFMGINRFLWEIVGNYSDISATCKNYNILCIIC